MALAKRKQPFGPSIRVGPRKIAGGVNARTCSFNPILPDTATQRNEFKGNFLPEVAAEAIISLIRGLTVTCAGRPELMRRPLYQVLTWLERAS
jgi:hypothetical protein